MSFSDWFKKKKEPDFVPLMLEEPKKENDFVPLEIIPKDVTTNKNGDSFSNFFDDVFVSTNKTSSFTPLPEIKVKHSAVNFKALIDAINGIPVEISHSAVDEIKDDKVRDAIEDAKPDIKYPGYQPPAKPEPKSDNYWKYFKPTPEEELQQLQPMLGSQYYKKKLEEEKAILEDVKNRAKLIVVKNRVPDPTKPVPKISFTGSYLIENVPSITTSISSSYLPKELIIPMDYKYSTGNASGAVQPSLTRTHIGYYTFDVEFGVPHHLVNSLTGTPMKFIKNSRGEFLWFADNSSTLNNSCSSFSCKILSKSSPTFFTIEYNDVSIGGSAITTFHDLKFANQKITLTLKYEDIDEGEISKMKEKIENNCIFYLTGDFVLNDDETSIEGIDIQSLNYMNTTTRKTSSLLHV